MKKITLTILMIGMFCLVVTAGVIINLDKEINLTKEKSDSLKDMGLNNYSVSDYSIGTDEVERCLNKKGSINSCQSFQTYYTNCLLYNETSYERECLESEKIYYTEEEILNKLNQWEDERLNKIAEVNINRNTNSTKEKIREGETIIN